MCAAPQFRPAKGITASFSALSNCRSRDPASSLSNKVHAVHQARSAFSLSITEIKKMQFSANSPQSRVQTCGLAPRRSVFLFWRFSYSAWQRSAFIKLKSELDLSLFICLALMGWPGFCSATAIMKNTIFMACIPWLTCEISAFLKLLFFTSTTCPSGVYALFSFHAVKSCVKNLCRNSRAVTHQNLFFV